MVCDFCVVFPVAIPATPPLFALRGLLPHSRSKFLAWPSVGCDGFPTPKRKSWLPGQIRAEKVLVDAPRPMCGPDGVAGDVSLTSRLVKAIFAKNKGYSGSSSSSGGEERKLSDQEEDHKKLRAHVELLSMQQRVWMGPETQGEPTRSGSGLEEDCQMEETDCKKKLDEQK